MLKVIENRRSVLSREAAQEYSPRRKPWVKIAKKLAPKGRRGTPQRTACPRTRHALDAHTRYAAPESSQSAFRLLPRNCIASYPRIQALKK